MDNNIKFIDQTIELSVVREMATSTFGDMVKGVIDVDKKLMAIGSELHADSEAVLLEKGSIQSDLWGINIYPEDDYPDRVEFDSLINIRPNQGNRSRDVEGPEIQKKILEIVKQLVSE
jgi:hypothetical protein